MGIIVGGKHKETVKRLESRIKEGSIKVFNEEEIIFLGLPGRYFGFQCYFCRKPIKGEVRILQDAQSEKGYESFSHYPIDIICYAKAKGIYNVTKDIIQNQTRTNSSY